MSNHLSQQSEPQRIIIGISGGIGSGKSTVSRVCRLMGYPVYDCDSRARTLINTSSHIRSLLTELLGSSIYSHCGEIQRTLLAQLLFDQAELRQAVNDIVHTEVKTDFRNWTLEQSSPVIFVESAIMATSGLARRVSSLWLVTAPEDLRISRVCRRSALTRQQVQSRINAQHAEESLIQQLPHSTIVNDDTRPILPQIVALLQEIK